MRFGLPLGASYWEHPMHRDPRAKELANLKEALTNFEHQLDLFEARIGCQPKASPARDLPSPPPQIAFANNVVAAMKNRMTEDCAMAGMRRSHLS
jgi:hypothetical protein